MAALRDAVAAGFAVAGLPPLAVTTGPRAVAEGDHVNLWAWQVATDPAPRPPGGAPLLRMTVLVRCWADPSERALVLAGTVMAALATNPVLADGTQAVACPVPEALLPLLARRPADAPALCYELRFGAR